MKANIVSIAMMICIFVVAYILDGFNDLAKNIAEETINFRFLPWVKISSYLIFAGAIITTEYLIVKQKWGNRIVSYIFLVSGLLILFITSPLFISIWMLLPRFQFPRTLIVYPTVGQMVAQASAFVALIGFICLLSRNRE